VLVIDDEAAIRLLCRVNLEAHGMEVLEAADGPSGLERARAERPDAIVLDLMLPGLDGWQVAERLLADPQARPAALVFLTGRVELRERAHALGFAGVDYLSKPFEPDELAAAVAGALQDDSGGEPLGPGSIAALRELTD
jgi:DNA-binding response OmpR family regulator